MTTLEERAAAKAGRTEQAPTAEQAPPASYPTAPLPDFDDITPGPDGPESVPVHVAWSRVMQDIRSIGKNETYSAAGTRYNFRGVDTTVNAFAPVLRKHGVLVLPVKVTAAYRDFINSNKKLQRECTVTVAWLVRGPAGDDLPILESAGEALDSADKGTAKAQSVALRVLLLTAAMVPTGDPDPDSQHIERGEPVTRSIRDYLDEIFNPATRPDRLRQIRYELGQQQRLQMRVQNETGETEEVYAIIDRVGRERAAGGAQ